MIIRDIIESGKVIIPRVGILGGGERPTRSIRASDLTISITSRL